MVYATFTNLVPRLDIYIIMDLLFVVHTIFTKARLTLAKKRI